MPYLGNIPAEAFSSFDKQTITGNGGTSYTLTHPVGSAQEVAIFVNNVRQEPGVAYTVTGTALTMTGNVESTDDFYAIFIGKARLTANPADNTITAAMLQSDSVTTAKLANNAVTTAKLFSGFANGVVQTDHFRLTANKTSDGDLTANFERVDDASFGKIGSGLTESSGVFSFPATGLYLVTFVYKGLSESSDNIGCRIYVTTDNSSYDDVAQSNCSTGTGSGDNTGICQAFVNCTDTSNVKFKMNAFSLGGSSAIVGDTNTSLTHVTTVRLGDSV